MQLSPSAHVDTFTRDHLPPVDQWADVVFDLPELRYPQRLNCAVELLDSAIAELGADRPCLLTATEQWTYGELARRSNQIARVLVEDLGVVPGNRVLLRAPNKPLLLACWFAVLKAGGVVVTTMPLLRETELRIIGEIASVDLSLVDHRWVDDLDGADIGPYIRFGGDDPDDLVALAAKKTDTFEPVLTAADDVALLALTSGTTGRPKAAMHFHRDVMASADTFGGHVLRLRPDDVATCSAPLSTSYGTCSMIMWSLRAGAAVLLLEKGTPDLLLPALSAHRVSVLFTAPTAYRAMLASMDGAAPPRLRLCVSAGEPLPKATISAWQQATGVRPIDALGSTELLNAFISAGEDAPPGSTGSPVPGYRATVLDADGNLVPDGTPGDLAIQGPTCCRYLNDSRQTTHVRRGWNLTGDTYLRDPDGYFWYQARSDDMIVSAGYNIAGPEVEQALGSHPDVLESAVVGVPDPGRTMLVKAFVVLRPGVNHDDAKANEIQEHCRAQLASYKCPRLIEFLEVLPRNASGKVLRFVLRNRAAGQAPGG